MFCFLVAVLFRYHGFSAAEKTQVFFRSTSVATCHSAVLAFRECQKELVLVFVEVGFHLSPEL